MLRPGPSPLHVLHRVRPDHVQVCMAEVVDRPGVVGHLLQVLEEPVEVPLRLVPRPVLVTPGELLHLQVDHGLEDSLPRDLGHAHALVRPPLHLGTRDVAVDPIHVANRGAVRAPDPVHVLGALHDQLRLVQAALQGREVCICDDAVCGVGKHLQTPLH
eukprot:215127-Hanusia_phi.AAC.1